MIGDKVRSESCGSASSIVWRFFDASYFVPNTNTLTIALSAGLVMNPL
jgi:hypothetical protein